ATSVPPNSKFTDSLESGRPLKETPIMSSRAKRGICFCLLSTRNSRCFAASQYGRHGCFSSPASLAHAPILLEELGHTRRLRLLVGHAQVDAFEHLRQGARSSGVFGRTVLEESLHILTVPGVTIPSDEQRQEGTRIRGELGDQ